MDTFTTVVIVTIILVTINTFITLFQLHSTEKERVKYGYPAFNNFDYYYPMFSWLFGVVTLILMLFIPFKETDSAWVTIGYCLIAIGVYFLTTLIATFILSNIQATLIKKKSK